MTSTAKRRTRIGIGIAAVATTAAGATIAALVVGSAPDEVAGEPVTLRPNPSYRASEPFQGWGTSLVWFAHATGGYPEDLREELYQLVFGEEGLNLTIARYNVGGGNATDVDSAAYMRKGGDVPGWWDPSLAGPDGAVRDAADAYRAAFDADDDASYDLDADAGQRWWVERLAQEGRITHWEAFSNSPPWFMTESGYATGGLDATSDQLRADSVEDFAAYMVRVVEHLEQTYGIEVATIDPMNEPNTDYWATRFTPEGELEPGRQEGAHLSPALQARLVEALAARLADPSTTTDATVSGPDETNPRLFLQDWEGWTPAAREAVGQLNVHTYGTEDRVQVRDVAKATGKPLWMSEVEGDFSLEAGFDLDDMANGLGMAGRIVDDLRELEPRAWVFWQPVEDRWHMELESDGNWGSIYIDLDCGADGTSARRVAAGHADPTCRVLTNTKFDTVRNFTHYIEPGDSQIAVDDPSTTAFVHGDGTGATLVHVNTSSEDRAVTLDLSLFGDTDGATVTPVVTTAPPAVRTADSAPHALVPGEAVRVRDDGTVTLPVPAKSVTTFLVEGVSGVADGAAPADGTPYALFGLDGDLALTAVDDATTVETPDGSAGQTWTLHTLSGEGTNRRVVALTDGTGAFLASTEDGTALVPSDLGTARTAPAQQWLLNSIDGRTYSLLNVATTRQLDVTRRSAEPGTPVALAPATTDPQQAWRFEPAS
ncbi:glycoside hydrolase [Cellulomonas fengjieae]|uniref:glycoside hydrolase n=1 Tax=Cellulomonas fengjieae TaxID=2819978 RepID=UPI001AB00635|nr:glycoside hydrolase [Cellulomonas fengjieae]MBO3103932.1 RICIN domain-containing protein [Cellulomonas fengjieae]